MAESTAQVKEHKAFKLLSAVKTRIESTSAMQEVVGDERWLRLNSLFSFLSTNMENSDAILIPSNALTAVVGPLQNINNSLNAFADDKNFSHISSGINDLGAAVTQFPTVYRHRFKQPYQSNLDDALQGLSELAKQSREKSQEIAENIVSIKSQQKSVEENLKTHKSQVDTIIEQTRSEFQAKLGEWQSEFREKISGNSADFKEFQSESREKFDAHLNEMKGSFEKKLATADDELEKKLNKAQDTTSEIVSDYKISFASARGEMQNMLEEIRNIYGLVGNTAITGSFTEQAKQERGAANFYRWMAVIFMFAAAAVFIVPYILALKSGSFDLTLQNVLARIPFSTLLLIPAAYAARESGKHRESERNMKTIQLQISALDPFIDKLDDVHKEDIKRKLVDRYFTGAQSEAGRPQRPDEEAGMLRQIFEAVKNIRPGQ